MPCQGAVPPPPEAVDAITRKTWDFLRQSGVFGGDQLKPAFDGKPLLYRDEAYAKLREAVAEIMWLDAVESF